MKHYILILLVIYSSNMIAQSQDVDILLNTIYNNLISNNGTSINFEYVYENQSHQMNNPIKGNIAFFSNNRFFIKLEEEAINMFQFYDGNSLFTVLIDDKEIQIDNLSNESKLLIQNFIKDYQNDYDRVITRNNEELTIIQLTPKNYDYMQIYNHCIDSLQLPTCLKLPKQCRIGIDSLKQIQLDNCTSNIQNEKTKIKSINIEFNQIKQQIESITQVDQFNGKTTVNIISIQKANENLLNLDSLKYKDFEIIDLRDIN